MIYFFTKALLNICAMHGSALHAAEVTKMTYVTISPFPDCFSKGDLTNLIFPTFEHFSETDRSLCKCCCQAVCNGEIIL